MKQMKERRKTLGEKDNEQRRLKRKNDSTYAEEVRIRNRLNWKKNKNRYNKRRRILIKNNKEYRDRKNKMQKKSYYKYRESRKERMKKYFNTENGKKIRIKHNAKKEGLGDIQLYENILDEKEIPIVHHVTDEKYVFIPDDFHRLYSSRDTEKHREMLVSIVKQLYPDYQWDG